MELSVIWDTTKVMRWHFNGIFVNYSILSFKQIGVDFIDIKKALEKIQHRKIFQHKQKKIEKSVKSMNINKDYDKRTVGAQWLKWLWNKVSWRNFSLNTDC